MRNLIASALVLTIFLSACGSNDDAMDENGASDAAGEVQGGSISDEMLPLTTVTSTSPPLKESSGATASGSDQSAATDAAEDATPAEDPAAAQENAPAASEPPADASE